MHRYLVLFAALMLSGCSSLNVSWSLTATYNTLAQTRTLTEHAPAAAEEAKPVPPPPSAGR